MEHTIISYIPQLLAYLPVTIEYVAASLLFGSLFAVVLLVMKLAGPAPVRWIAEGITTLGRCCPTIIMLFLVYYGLPPVLYNLTGVDIEGYDAIYFVIVSFSFFLGGSLSEVARSAYLSIDRGQFEAAECCGLTRLQTLRRIVVPQLLYLMIPNLGNTVQFLMKEGALTYLIGCIDLTGAAYLINGRELSAYVLQVYVALALIFWVISIAVDWLFARLEAKFGAGYLPPEQVKRANRGGRGRGGRGKRGGLRAGGARAPYRADVTGIRAATKEVSAQ